MINISDKLWIFISDNIVPIVILVAIVIYNFIPAAYRTNMIVVMIVGAGYFAPTIAAYIFNRDELSRVFKINLYWGWSGLGWYIALWLAIGIEGQQEIFSRSHPIIALMLGDKPEDD